MRRSDNVKHKDWVFAEIGVISKRLICMLKSDDAQYKEAVLLLAKGISELPCLHKKVLALYYCENMPLGEIAACLDLSECEIEKIRAETVGLFRTTLAGQMGLRDSG